MLLVMIGIIKVDFDRNSGFILYLRKSLFTNHSVRITIHIIEKISFWAYSVFKLPATSNFYLFVLIALFCDASHPS